MLRCEPVLEMFQPGVLIAMRSLVSGSSTSRAAPHWRTSQKPRVPIAQAGQCLHWQSAIPQGLSRAKVVPVAGSTDGPTQVDVTCRWTHPWSPCRARISTKLLVIQDPGDWRSGSPSRKMRAQGWAETHLQHSSSQDWLPMLGLTWGSQKKGTEDVWVGIPSEAGSYGQLMHS